MTTKCPVLCFNFSYSLYCYITSIYKILLALEHGLEIDHMRESSEPKLVGINKEVSGYLEILTRNSSHFSPVLASICLAVFGIF